MYLAFSFNCLPAILQNQPVKIQALTKTALFVNLTFFTVPNHEKRNFVVKYLNNNNNGKMSNL